LALRTARRPGVRVEKTRHCPCLHCGSSGKRHLTTAVFFARCGVFAGEGLQSPNGRATLNPDAEPSRKERGHRGVRPRHPNRKASGLDGAGSSSGPEPRRFLFSCSLSFLGLFSPVHAHGYTGSAVHPRGRQASTWSAREDGGESRSRAASLNTRENHKCGLSRVRPRCLANTRRVRSRAPLACGGEGRDQKAGSPGTVRLCQAREI